MNNAELGFGLQVSCGYQKPGLLSPSPPSALGTGRISLINKSHILSLQIRLCCCSVHMHFKKEMKEYFEIEIPERGVTFRGV